MGGKKGNWKKKGDNNKKKRKKKGEKFGAHHPLPALFHTFPFARTEVYRPKVARFAG